MINRLITTTAITLINNRITWYKIRSKDEFGEKASDRIKRTRRSVLRETLPVNCKLTLAIHKLKSPRKPVHQ